MAIGAVCASVLPELDVIAGLHQSGDWVFPGLGALVLIAGGLGLLGLMGMCVYGGSLTLITAIDSIRTVRPTRGIRMVTILIIGLTATVAAAMVPEDFLNTQLATVLFVVGYFMAPWTAVNLTDFFVVRRGRYSIAEMFKPDGVYGLWNWRGIITYVATLIIMVPFMNLGFYVGPVAEALGGIDIAFFVGIPVACAMYWLLCLNQDIRGEFAQIEGADDDIDVIAAPIA
jgi:purine-cytosine permease-like protein